MSKKQNGCIFILTHLPSLLTMLTWQFFFTVSDKLNYTKKPLTLNEQVSLLEKQGLIIDNKKNGLQFFTQEY